MTSKSSMWPFPDMSILKSPRDLHFDIRQVGCSTIQVVSLKPQKVNLVPGYQNHAFHRVGYILQFSKTRMKREIKIILGNFHFCLNLELRTVTQLVHACLLSISLNKKTSTFCCLEGLPWWPCSLRCCHSASYLSQFPGSSPIQGMWEKLPVTWG